MGSCSLASSGGMPITSWDAGHPHAGISWSLQTLVEVFTISCTGLLLLWLYLLGWDGWWTHCPGWWLWVSNALCHRLLQTYLWHEPYSSCCGFVPEKLGDLAGSDVWDDVILTQCEGGVSSRTSALVNVVKGSMAHWSSSTLSPIWWGSPSGSSWTFSTQYCRALAYAKVFWGCLMW